MNFPSLDHIYRESSKTLRRFPLALTSAVIASLLGVYYVEQSRDSAFLIKTIMVTILGISWFTVIELFSEKLRLSGLKSVAVKLFGIVLLILYFFQLPENPDESVSKYWVRYLLFFLGAHLLVAFAPYMERGSVNAFWQYNKTLFIRFLTAFLYSNVLYVGLIIAILSIDNLFGVDIPDKTYSQLWILIVGIFNTWFFLSGVPNKLRQLQQKTDYPKGLKIFTQFILIPLVIIYLVILYLYTGKIIIEWEWPEGWVAILVLSFSIAGIFALLLLEPIREKVENRWIRTFSRYYYIALGPLVILLLLAIWRRVSEYGFTENRYFVMILGLWLGGVSIYFTFSRKKNIKIIPVSLCILAFLISFGPWGAFHIAETSQVNRLERLLLDNKILANGNIREAPSDLPFEDRQEISAILLYLHDAHGYDAIQPWFDMELARSTGQRDTVYYSSNRWVSPQKIVDEMGFEYINPGQYRDQSYYYFSAAPEGGLGIEGYDWMISFSQYYNQNKTRTTTLNGRKIATTLDPDQLIFEIRVDTVNQVIDLQPLIDELMKITTQVSSQNIPAEKLFIETGNDRLRTGAFIHNINISREGETRTINSMNVTLFLSVKEL